MVFNGQINDGAGQLALTMSGNGMLTLGNTNTYSGATTVAGGMLSANVPGAFSPNSAGDDQRRHARRQRLAADDRFADDDQRTD